MIAQSDISTQLKNVYQLLNQKKDLTESLLARWNKIDKFLLKTERCDLKTYLSNLRNQNLDEATSKISEVGKKFLGGLDSTDRDIILGFYILSKGQKMLKTENPSLVHQLHEILITLISTSIKSKSYLNNRLNPLSILIEDIDKYSKSLKDADVLLSLIDKSNFVLAIENEDRINKSLKEKINKILQQKIASLANKTDAEKFRAEQFIEHMLQKFIGSVRNTAYTGLLIIMLLTQSNILSASNPGDPKASPPIPLVVNSPEPSIVKVENFDPIFPTKITDITSLFGRRIITGGSPNHMGIDVSCPNGTAIRAIADGKITVLNLSGYGLCAIIDHGNIASFYAHLSKTKYKTGYKVKKGDIIAFSGGFMRNGEINYHLHFGMGIPRDAKSPITSLDKMDFVDPMPFFNASILTKLTLNPRIARYQKTSSEKFLKLLAEKNPPIPLVRENIAQANLNALNPNILKEEIFKMKKL